MYMLSVEHSSFKNGGVRISILSFHCQIGPGRGVKDKVICVCLI
jgi:hypothetical protein